MPARHIVAMLPPAWGHTVSYIHAATQIISKDPAVIITVVQHALMVGQMETELAACSYDKARLRIIGVGPKDMEFGPSKLKEALEQLIGGWMGLLPQLATGSEEWPKPAAVHLDFVCGGFVVGPTKKFLGPECKTLVWWSSAVASLPMHFTDHDFFAICDEISADESRRQGRSKEEILQQVFEASNGTDKRSGTVVHSPGGPDMYDYERHAYAAGPPAGLGMVISTAQKLGQAADGYIAVASLCMEPIGVPYCREFLKKDGKELFTIGMQAHELSWSGGSVLEISNERVQAFLDGAVSQYGEKSVLYISFGSLFFPVATPQLIEALITTLLDLEQPFPFIFALGSKMASLPAELIQRVNDSGKGLICSFWVEQRAILQHRGIGWFLTHGGFNSISEALLQNIPFIIWPVGGEQPTNAALLSTGPNAVAFELFQVRTGPQLGPSLHTDATITGTVADAVEEFRATFAAARGASGAVLQANAARMAAALKEEHIGQAAEELKRLARF
ncbi:hypothetical protein C8R47DRAFT_1251687 [Mycena vitilis]|nr:hypothetical protein C8R47DRAFT_1251687 [Mycena vitilis]